jgi:hypothetical protein
MAPHGATGTQWDGFSTFPGIQPQALDRAGRSWATLERTLAEALWID